MRPSYMRPLSLSLLLSVVFPAVHMYRVFVYGTLKKGQPNHHEMVKSENGQAEFLTSARTVERFPLVIATEYHVPFLLNVPGAGERVHGEIYSVDQKMLDFLDWFEGCPKMYQRTTVQLEVLKDGNTMTAGSIVEAFVYSTTSYKPDWLHKHTHENYDADGDHGLKYVARLDRTPKHLDL